MNSHQAIGIFDSGIGGLTVANAIQQVLPNENLIYFGDTAHLPYGDKSPEIIQRYSLKIAQFLKAKNCKAIVVACNTASSLAYNHLLDQMGNSIPIYNVIDPVVSEIMNLHYAHIGVIGTKATITSQIFPKKIALLDANKVVKSLATPLLAPMIEEGFFDNKISATIIDSYLSSTELQDIDALVLACTHYPLIQKELEIYYKGKVAIINSAKIVANFIQKELSSLHLLNTHQRKVHQFYVSDYTDSFEKSAKMFFKEDIMLQKQLL